MLTYEQKRKLDVVMELSWIFLDDIKKSSVSSIDEIYELIDKKNLPNPFKIKTRNDIDNPHIFVLNIIRNTDWLYFTCKHIFNIICPPFQQIVLKELWDRPYPMFIASRGASKTFSLGLYSLLKSLICPGYRVVLLGSGFRQSKMIFEYCENIWRNAPILRELVCSTDADKHIKKNNDRWDFIVGKSLIQAVPIGSDGSKIRGLRGSVICDEFHTLSVKTYETVIQGFGAVAPNPVMAMKSRAKQEVLKKVGLWNNDLATTKFINQQIIAGTAYYEFNHFYKYWQRYKAIIESKGDHDKLQEIFNGEIPEHFDVNHYSIIRVPFELIPPGFMDETTVARSKAVIDPAIYGMEYGSIWATDSNGFFKRTLIESCVAGKPDSPIVLPNVGEVKFKADIKGDNKLKYVYGIDPAAEKDNFSIVILELHGNHRRIKYCWTTRKDKFKKRIKAGLELEKDFYNFCAKKIRLLMKRFPPATPIDGMGTIGMDIEGGGRPVEETLHRSAGLALDEVPLWRAINSESPLDEDGYPGNHILEMVTFSKAEWVSIANHGLKQDFQDKKLLFPYDDGVSMVLAGVDDVENERLMKDGEETIVLEDSLEEVIREIDELKDELATIVHTQTLKSGRDQWDTPEIIENGKKGRIRKDRYSALLIANAIARRLQTDIPQFEYKAVGRAVGQECSKDRSGPMFYGPGANLVNTQIGQNQTYGKRVGRK